MPPTMRGTARPNLGPLFDEGTTGPDSVENVGSCSNLLIFAQLLGQVDENANTRPVSNVSLNEEVEIASLRAPTGAELARRPVGKPVSDAASEQGVGHNSFGRKSNR